jgi:hypothetical protein
MSDSDTLIPSQLANREKLSQTSGALLVEEV